MSKKYLLPFDEIADIENALRELIKNKELCMNEAESLGGSAIKVEMKDDGSCMFTGHPDRIVFANNPSMSEQQKIDRMKIRASIISAGIMHHTAEVFKKLGIVTNGDNK